MNKFIHVRSQKFRILPGEEEELANEGLYGKALAEYLQGKLQDRGYSAPFTCAEDWGWWVELKDAPFTFGVCIYCGPKKQEPLDFFCTEGAASPKMWSWKKLQVVDTKPWVTKLHSDLVSIFQADPEVEVVGTDVKPPAGE